MRIPKHASDLDLTWVHIHLGDHLRSKAESVACARVGAAFGLAGVTYRIVVRCTAGIEVFAVKVCPRDAAAHEAWVYREVLPRTRVPAPVFVDVFDDGQQGVLVMRFVEGATQGDVLEGCTQSQTVALAQILGDLHAPWWGVTDDELPKLACYTPATATRPSDEVQLRCLLRHDPWISGGAEALRSNWTRRESDLATLASQPMTLTHRDYHLDNVLFSDAEPVVLDWERAGRQPAAQDVARLLFECHLPAQRRERDGMVRRVYLDRLAEHGVALDLETLDAGIEASRRVLLAGAVGWGGKEQASAAGSRSESLQRNLLRNLTAQ